MFSAITAVLWAVRYPDVKATHEHAVTGKHGSYIFTPSKAKFYTTGSGISKLPITTNSCILGTVRLIPDGPVENGFFEVGGFECVSHQRLYLLLGFAAAFSVVLLVFGMLARWVNAGFSKAD